MIERRPIPTEAYLLTNIEPSRANNQLESGLKNLKDALGFNTFGQITRDEVNRLITERPEEVINLGRSARIAVDTLKQLINSSLQNGNIYSALNYAQEAVTQWIEPIYHNQRFRSFLANKSRVGESISGIEQRRDEASLDEASSKLLPFVERRLKRRQLKLLREALDFMSKENKERPLVDIELGLLEARSNRKFDVQLMRNSFLELKDNYPDNLHRVVTIASKLYAMTVYLGIFEQANYYLNEFTVLVKELARANNEDPVNYNFMIPKEVGRLDKNWRQKLGERLLPLAVLLTTNPRRRTALAQELLRDPS